MAGKARSRTLSSSLMKQRFLALFMAGVVVFLAGCHGSKERVPDSRPFAQAPADIKDLWDTALAADRTNDYAIAQTLYYGLLRQPLTPEQKQAVDAASTMLNNRMLRALQTGDPAAKAALAELRRSPPNRPH